MQYPRLPSLTVASQMPRPCRDGARIVEAPAQAAVGGSYVLIQGLIDDRRARAGDMRDYTALDDVAEIWSDNTATGEDEVGNPGAGMYRYASGGQRYLPGQHPERDADAFNPEGTVTVYDTRPENERPPQYPPPKRA